jgi:hypothetical protein
MLDADSAMMVLLLRLTTRRYFGMGIMWLLTLQWSNQS